MLVIALIIAYVLYKCVSFENFAEKHHHSKKHHGHTSTHHTVSKSEAEHTQTQPQLLNQVAQPVHVAQECNQPKNTELWGVNSANDIFKAPYPCPINGSNIACQWQNVPGKLVQVSQGSHDIWGVNKDMKIFRCDKPCTGNWKLVPGLLTNVSVGHDSVWGINQGNVIFTCAHTKEAPCTGKWVADAPSSRLSNISI